MRGENPTAPTADWFLKKENEKKNPNLEPSPTLVTRGNKPRTTLERQHGTRRRNQFDSASTKTEDPTEKEKKNPYEIRDYRLR